MTESKGSAIVGLLLCWLLNIVHVGVATLLLFSSERLVPAALILIAAIGILQIAYVAPIYRLLQKHGKSRTARGLATAAVLTLVINLIVWGLLYYRFGRLLP